ncbi:patatin-like phospholipase family protein [soil metagenome]
MNPIEAARERLRTARHGNYRAALPERTAFVLSGGGNLGAVQVGMLRALFERRIRPDLIVGCSIGALNGAVVAAEPNLGGVGRLEDLWHSVEGRDVMPSGLLPPVVQMARKGISIHGNAGLRAIIEDVLPVRTFAELVVPFECVATAIDAVEEVWFAAGSLVEPILASGALPAVLPPVEIDGVRYVDGAVVNDIPVSRAVERGATTIYVLHVGSFERPRPEPRRPFDMALQAYWIARHHRFKRDLAALPADVEAVVLPTGQPPVLRFNDLGHSAELMKNAYTATASFLDARAAGGRAVTNPSAAADPAVTPADSPATTTVAPGDTG